MSHVRAHVLVAVALSVAMAVAGVGVWSNSAVAQNVFGQRLVLLQAVRGNWMQFNIISGRIQVTCSQVPNNVSNGPERLSIRPGGNQPVVEYEANLPEESFHVDVKDGNRLHVRREGKDKSQVATVDFLQAPDEALTLSIGGPGPAKVYQAAGLWQLLVIEPEVCRQHLVPLLELLRPDWRLAERSAQIEEEILHSAASEQLPDRHRWEELVKQLADDRFARREAADRELRAAGPAVMPYLERLDYARLEPEQQARVRRLLGELIQDIDDDTVSQAAVGLAVEPAVWVAMLGRSEEGTRRLAARQLARLLGGAIDFDPAAAAPLRQTQIERLRARILPR
jgi:hypothetical protein